MRIGHVIRSYLVSPLLICYFLSYLLTNVSVCCSAAVTGSPRTVGNI